MLAVIKKESVVIASPKRATFRVRTDTRGVGVGIKTSRKVRRSNLRTFLEVFMPTPTPRVSVRTRKVALLGLAITTLSFLITASIVTYIRQQPPVQKINYSQLYSFAEAGGAVALSVEGETMTMTKADGTLVEATVTGEAAQHEVVQLFRKSNVPVEFKPLQPGVLSTAASWVLPILTLGLIGFAAWRIYSSMSGRGSFELENHSGKQDVGFADVAGVDE